MKVVAIAIFLALPVVASAETAGEMLLNCRKLVAAQEDLNGDRLKVELTFGNGVCWGAFTTIQGFSRLVLDANSPGKTLTGVCAPKGTRLTEYIWAYIEYCRKHPEKMKEDFDMVVLPALWDAYPCK